jgi:hypothetical protein
MRGNQVAKAGYGWLRRRVIVWCGLATLGGWVHAAAAAPAVDVSAYNSDCGVTIRQRGERLTASWPGADGSRCAVEFSLGENKPLIASLEVGRKALVRDVNPVFLVTTGARVQRPGVKYIFFDKPIEGKNGPVRHYTASLSLKTVRVRSEGKRATISFGVIEAGPFAGELEFQIYTGSPLLQVDAAMRLDEQGVAYIYDAVLEGDFKTIAWKDLQDQFVRRNPSGEPESIAVRNRTIMAETEAGTVAVFPAPHAFFFPRDYTVNFKYAQVGKGRFGLRQDPAGGPGHQGAFIPWFDAPAGRTQHMSFFMELSAQKAEAALEEVKRYTHGDTLKPMEGFITLGTHMHAHLTVNENTDHPKAAEFKKVFKEMNFQAFQLAEFHGDGHPNDPGKVRLEELKGMFELCRKYSDESFLMLPSEEANAYFPGHSVLLFPRPVYLTLVPITNAPFAEELAPYGKVYHPQNASDLARVVREEQGLAWTSHPRIKGSEGCPDRFKEEGWYRDELWLGGTWKAMPGDLSEPRLGVRSLDLLDDMNLWGQRKYIVGEIDCFDVDRTHEIYGHLNVNYLRLDRLPATAGPILDVLRRGEFFVTTGEVLIHSCKAKGNEIIAELEWTFPLRQAELVVCDGKTVRRQTVALSETKQFGRQTFHWRENLKGAQWFRMEVWDIASDGAFTQPIYLPGR